MQRDSRSAMSGPLRYRLVLLTVLAITVAVYRPGLYGGYLFDDYPNFVENTDVHVASLDWRDWRAAAQASPSSQLRRPLAMLSLALNYYFTQLDPFPLKAVNLAIHLVNGLLLWRVLLALLGLWRNRTPAISDSTVQLAALGITCAWLLAPINLSAVLYVVQRMESLAQTFVLAGLWLYLAGRRRMLASAGSRGISSCAVGLILGSGLGLLCKESAVLLPVYAFLIECTILRFEAGSPDARRALWLGYGLLLILPTLLGLAWLLPREMSDAAYAGRPFTLGQRLLTECRILVDYAAWTLFPHPAALSFYHDDIAISRGWLDPPATLACAALIAASMALAAGLRHRLPLLSLGIGWYFAAHLLTATVIPLELVFEHRNYFASIGLLLAAGALILCIPARFRLLRWALPLLGLVTFMAVAGLRARDWRDPIAFAYAEALIHPESPRAAYELGRTLTVASGYRADTRLITPAMAAFERAGRLPAAGATPWASLIVVAGHMHYDIQAEWWEQLIDRLRTQPVSAESISALESLYNCQHQQACPLETRPLLSAFLAAMDHPPPQGRLLAAYGTFAANQLGDYALAERLLGDALGQLPAINGIRFNLVKVLLLEGKPEQAASILSELDPGWLRQTDLDEVAALRKSIELTSRAKQESRQSRPGER